MIITLWAPHREPIRRRVRNEAPADLALGLGMQCQRHAGRRCRARARVVVRSRANAAEAEHRVARSESAPQYSGYARRMVSEILTIREPQAALGQCLDNEGEVLVLPLAEQDFVPDDKRTEVHGTSLATPPSIGSLRSCASSARQK